MEGVLPKVRCQIIADFNRKNAAERKTFTVRHFKKMEYKKNRHLSCDAIDGYRKVSRADKKPRMLTAVEELLTAVEELKVKSSINNKNSVSIPNLFAFDSSAYLRSLGDSHFLFWAFFALC